MTDGVAERYHNLKKIGAGAFGVVYKADDIYTGRVIALKKITLETQDEGVPSTTLREICILKEVQHPNIVSLLDVILNSTAVYLAFEFMQQDLKHLIDRQKHGLTGKTLKVVKLADFGLARAFHLPLHTYTHEVVTLWYRAPEILLGDPHYSPGIDVWSVGCIFAEMATKQPLFKGDSEIGQLIQIFSILGTPNEEVWPGVTSLTDYASSFPQCKPQPLGAVVGTLDCKGVDLLSKMLCYDPKQRVTAKGAIQDPYIQEVLNAISVCS